MNEFILLLQVTELTSTVEGLEKERDFYFGKLRDVEILCQQHENDGVTIVQDILNILYATEVVFYIQSWIVDNCECLAGHFL